MLLENSDLERQHQLFAETINPQLAKVLSTIGFDVSYVKAQGAYLWDKDGRRYLDCLAGYGVFNIGRNHPRIKEAVKEAIDADLPNMVQMDAPLLAALLAERLLKKMPAGIDKCFFTNSGAEAIEGAIKFARKATGRQRLLFWDHAFHGLTTGSLALNGNVEFRDGFGDLLPGAKAILFNNLPSLEEELKKGDVAAFVIEPVQGKGIYVASDSFYAQAQALCQRYGTLFVVDEVQTGFGRTGKLFAFEHWNLQPDIVCVAKALSGGVIPVGAVLYPRWVYEKVYPDMSACMIHSNTFGRNTLAMVAGLATLEVIEEENLVERARITGEKLKSGFEKFVGRFEMVKEIRGKGLMLAMEFGEPRSFSLKAGWKLLNKMHAGLFAQMVVIPLFKEHRILTQVAGHHTDVIRLLPPLMISEEDVAHILSSFEKVLEACHQFPGSAWKIGKDLVQMALRS